ncbi:SphA family protein [Burkholderia vietnamiensis]|uniref:SphA family protein n=1 Tax=Burkholderia vietnamiensis TaxID=60552 RepID=UPI003F5101B5
MTKGLAKCAKMALVLACAYAGAAHAFEGGVSPYPPGATGTNFANFPPIPGLFALEQFNYSYSNGLYGNDGNKLPIPFRTSVFSATTRVLASYPFQFLGANVYSQLVLPFVSLHTNVYGQKNTQNGLANITVSPVILSWHPVKNVEVSTGLDIATESGSYSPTKPSVAVGYTSFQPVLAFRYNNPQGLDIGMSNRLMLNTKNNETGYRSGDGYVAEFGAGWNIGKWKVGLVGAYLNQYRDDSINGTTVVGNRAKSFQIGPSIVYDFGPVNINLNYQQGVYAANTSKSSSVWFNIAIPLWAKVPKSYTQTAPMQLQLGEAGAKKE